MTANAPELRPYQETLVAEVRARFNRDGFQRVLMVLPTGGGKTVIFCYITARTAAAGKRVWIVVHRDELLTQTAKALDSFRVRHGVIGRGQNGTWHQVQVCSVQTLVRRLHKLEPPDLIILDEAHHATAGQWAKLIEWAGDTPIIGVTATACRLDGKGLGDDGHGRVIFQTMVLGPTSAELTRDGYLAPAVIYAPELADTSHLHSRMGDYKKEETAALMDKPTICGEAVSYYRKYAYGKRIIVFCVNLFHVNHTVEAYTAAGIPAAAIDGSLTPAVRAQRVQDFSDNRILVLVSCEIVSEGFDVPGCDGVQMLRPTQSLGLYLQQVGRALRPAPGKLEAIILDHVGNVGRMINGVFVPRHGLPDQDREWTLEGSKRGQSNRGSSFALRECSNCLHIFPASLSACYRCGTQVVSTEDKTPEVIEGELAKVTVPEITPEREKWLLENARTLQDWHNVARQLRKSSGWAYRQHCIRTEELIRQAAQSAQAQHVAIGV